MHHRTVEVIGATTETTQALTAYLNAVGVHLSRWGVRTDNVCVYAPTPHRGLAASMVLHPAPRPDNTDVAQDEIPAGWHEELGWWINADTDSRWHPHWLGMLIPSAANAAATLASALPRYLDPTAHPGANPADGPDGSPQVLRYRSEDAQLLGELRHATI